MSVEKFPFTSAECEQEVDFLQVNFIDKCNSLLHLTDDIVQAFYVMLDVISKDEDLRARAISGHNQLFHTENVIDRNIAVQELIDFVAQSPEKLAMFIPVILVSAIPHLCHYYRERGISAEVLRDTLFDLELNLRRDKLKSGYWGTDKLVWLIQHFISTIFQLGRFQFHFYPFEYKIQVYRHLLTSEIAVFAGDQVAYRADGCIDGTNGIFDLEWVADFEHSPEFIKGHLINSSGIAGRDTTQLSAKEWEQVLAQHDTTVMVHIPDGSKMTPQLSHDSYKRAIAFFDQYFAEVKYTAFFCMSWLLAPQWRDLLSAEANIIHFQNDFQLFPVLSDEIQTYERVFGNTVLDYATAPQETQLQRSLLEHLKTGGRVHSGAGFMLKSKVTELI